MKVLFIPITSEQKQNGYCGFRNPLDRACSLVSLFTIDEFDVKDSPQEPQITVLIAFFVVTAGSIPFWIECHHPLHYPCHHQHFCLTACLGI